MQINFGSLKLCKSTKPVPDITCHLDSFGEPVKLALGRCHQTRIKVLLVFYVRQYKLIKIPIILTNILIKSQSVMLYGCPQYAIVNFLRYVKIFSLYFL